MNAPNKIYLYWNKENDPCYVTWDTKKLKGAINIPYVRQNSIKLCDNIGCDRGKAILEGEFGAFVGDCKACKGKGFICH